MVVVIVRVMVCEVVRFVVGTFVCVTMVLDEVLDEVFDEVSDFHSLELLGSRVSQDSPVPATLPLNIGIIHQVVMSPVSDIEPELDHVLVLIHVEVVVSVSDSPQIHHQKLPVSVSALVPVDMMTPPEELVVLPDTMLPDTVLPDTALPEEVGSITTISFWIDQELPLIAEISLFAH